MAELVCKHCGNTALQYIKEWNMQSYGVKTNVKLYKCPKCGKQNRTGTVIQRSEYTPKKKTRKTQSQRATSIAKQVSLGQFKKMNQKMKPREIAALLCQHHNKKEEKARCGACLRNIHRLTKKLDEIEIKDKTFDVLDDFLEIPVVQKFIEDRKLRQVGYKPHIGRLQDYWNVLERKHPSTWDSHDIGTLIKYIREKGVVPYHHEASLRAWFSFTDAKDPQGRKLVDHPLLEASREKMTRPNTTSAERASVSRNFLEPKEFIKVLEETDDLLFKAMLWVHVTTGCRVGKKEADYGRGRGGVLGLSWDNVNWEERTIDVYETKTKGGLTWVDCPLDLFGDKCYSVLNEYWVSEGRPERGRIFPIKYRSYSGFFKDVVSRVVGRGLRPRVLRNSHATWLLNMGVKVEFVIGTVSRRLREGYALGVGWMEPRMFFEYYARILRRAKRNEIIRAQEAFRELTIVHIE